MAAPIPQTFIDELLSRIDIVEVIGGRVALKKQGREFSACCPFHAENTPSFTVSPNKQFYHCFGCGAHGSAIGFMMEFEHLGFVDAVIELAESMHLEVPREASSSENQYRDLLDVMRMATDFYQQSLQRPAGAGARQYLQQRGLSDDLIQKFAIGYAPEEWQSLEQALMPKVSAAELFTAGLTVQRDSGRTYDKFRHRIMFPIRDRRGRPIAFGGRALTEQGPKYLNSPQTPLFHKGRELYGLWEAREVLKKRQQVLVVEGYMDVIGLARQEIFHAVATLGTATTTEHVQQLFRLVPELVFCFDGDGAGRRAAWRALEVALPMMEAGRQVKFVFLPQGEDPDSWVAKEGREAFLSQVKQAVPLSQFLLERYHQVIDCSTPDGKAQLIAKIAPYIKRVPDGIYRDLLLDQLVNTSKMSREQLKYRILGPDGSYVIEPGRVASKGKIVGGNLMRRAVAMLAQKPQLASLVNNKVELAQVDRPGISILLSLLATIANDPNIHAAVLLERYRGTEHEGVLAKLQAWQLMVPEEGMAAEFQAILERILSVHQNSRLEQLIDKSRHSPLNESEMTEWAALLERDQRTEKQ